MKQTIALTLLWSALALSLVGCIREASSSSDFDALGNFDWATTKSSSISVAAPASIAAGEVASVKIYSAASCDESSLIASGVATAQRPFATTLDLGSECSTVFVKTTRANGLSDYQAYTIGADGTRAVMQSRAVATRAALPTIEIPSITIPTSFDETITAATTLVGSDSKANYTYYIAAGTTISAKKMNVSNYKNHVALYVAGELQIETLDFQHCSLVILDGGEVGVNKLSFSNFKQGDTALYVCEGGKLTINDNLKVSTLNEAVMVNCGEVVNEGETGFSNSGSFYNAGTYTSKEGDYTDEINVTNYFKFYNTGLVRAESFSMNSSAKLLNYAPGKVQIEEDFKSSNQTVEIGNYGGFFEVGEKIDVQGTFNNYGYVGCDVMKSNVMTMTIGTGCLVECNKTMLHSSTVNMEPGSLYTTFDMSDKGGYYNSTFRNTGDDWALILVYKSDTPMREHQYSGDKFDGKIEVNYQLYDKPTQQAILETPSCSNSAYFTADQTVNIPTTDWNKGKGDKNPTPEIVDTDHDGVPDDEDAEPENPDVTGHTYFPSASTWATYAFEDLWPEFGDYDMNDVVIDVQYLKATDVNNRVTYVKINWSLRALGSQREIAAGVQFDGLSANGITVERTSEDNAHFALSSAPIGSTNGGLEAGQSYAVVALFNAVSDVYERANYMMNTQVTAAGVPINYIEPTRHSVKLTFANRPDASQLALSNCNLFIVTNDKNVSGRGNEIHLCTYAATDLANDANKNGGVGKSVAGKPFVNVDGKVWAMMTPAQFAYPVESVAIEKAYNYFKPWYQSLNTQHQSWYKKESENINEEHIFPRH